MAAASSIAIASLAVAVAGAGVSAYGQVQQGKSQEAIAKYNAAIENNRAIQSQQDANAAAASQRRQADALQKRQRALYAKSGVTGEGTPLSVMIDSAQEMELMALDIERGGDIAATQHRSQAAIDKFSGRAARQGSIYGAGATLLQGAGSIGSSYAEFKQAGTIPKT